MNALVELEGPCRCGDQPGHFPGLRLNGIKDRRSWGIGVERSCVAGRPYEPRASPSRRSHHLRPLSRPLSRRFLRPWGDEPCGLQRTLVCQVLVFSGRVVSPTTRLRPDVLARYRASSAEANRVEGLRCSDAFLEATPTLTLNHGVPDA